MGCAAQHTGIFAGSGDGRCYNRRRGMLQPRFLFLLQPTTRVLFLRFFVVTGVIFC